MKIDLTLDDNPNLQLSAESSKDKEQLAALVFFLARFEFGSVSVENKVQWVSVPLNLKKRES